MKNSNVQDPETPLTMKATKEEHLISWLQSEIDKLNEVARFYELPVKSLIFKNNAKALSVENCLTCPFKTFLYSHNAGCFATKLWANPFRLPTRFADGKTPDKKPKWCPLNKIAITVSDGT